MTTVQSIPQSAIIAEAAPHLHLPLTIDAVGDLTVTAQAGHLTLRVLTDIGGIFMATVTRKQGSIWESLIFKALQADGSEMPASDLTYVLINIRRAGDGPFVVRNGVCAYDSGTGWCTYSWADWPLSAPGEFDVTGTYPYSSGANPAIAPSRGSLRLVVEQV